MHSPPKTTDSAVPGTIVKVLRFQPRELGCLKSMRNKAEEKFNLPTYASNFNPLIAIE